MEQKENKTIVFDMDGTLASVEHRRHHVTGQRPNWKAFFDLMDQDPVIEEVADLARLAWAAGWNVIIVSARPDDYREITEEWLDNLGGEGPLNYHKMYMRKAGDYRRDDVVKQEILEQMRSDGYEPWMVVDDRDMVVDMWRKNGIMALQCAERQEDVAKGNPVLYVMVGPAGAGKTTHIEQHLPYPYRVSTDEIRVAANRGDIEDMSRNDEVFKAAHEMTKTLLMQGIDVVFDATNIRNRDRKKVVNLAPEGTKVVYIVVDRPMDDKMATRGWRPDWLIEKHDNTFHSNLKDILKGDNLDVEVIDTRK